MLENSSFTSESSFEYHESDLATQLEALFNSNPTNNEMGGRTNPCAYDTNWVN